METKICIRCLQEKPIEQFPYKSLIKRTRQTVCKTCTAKRSSEWYENNRAQHIQNVSSNKLRYREYAREYIRIYLASHPCSVCGETDPVVLEFHHRGEKDFAIADLIGNSASLDSLIAEINKCDVVCANCHRRITVEERGWRR